VATTVRSATFTPVAVIIANITTDLAPVPFPARIIPENNTDSDTINKTINNKKNYQKID